MHPKIVEKKSIFVNRFFFGDNGLRTMRTCPQLIRFFEEEMSE